MTAPSASPCSTCAPWQARVRELETQLLIMRECAAAEADRGNEAEAEVERLTADRDAWRERSVFQSLAQMQYRDTMKAKLNALTAGRA